MCSYLSAASVAEIAPPDYDLRYRLLLDFAAQTLEQGALPAQIVGYLAAEVAGNVRDLEDVIEHIRRERGGQRVTMDDAMQIVASVAPRSAEYRRQDYGGQQGSMDDATQIVTSLTPRSAEHRIRIIDIQDAVSLHFGVKRDVLLSRSSVRLLVRARQIGMYLARNMTGNSIPEIGRRFGDRDHTTVLHGCRRIERLLQTDAQLAADITAIREQLK